MQNHRLYYIQYKISMPTPEQGDWLNLVAFPMPWETAQGLFETLREVAGPDHPLRVIDFEAE
jgi:hypothetical protein